MLSAFSARKRQLSATAQASVDETYDLKGLNLIAPDNLMPTGESPYTINSRMYAREDDESRVANRTRKGAGFLSTPMGETLNVQNVGASTGDSAFTTSTYVAEPFTPSAGGALTRLDLHIKKVAGATGHVIVEIYSNNAGLPGTMIAQGSIQSQVITTAYQYLPAYFIDAPTLVNGTQYWVLVYIQDNGSGTYNLTKTATVVQAQSTADAGSSWTALGYSLRYKTYLSTTGGVRGYHLRYPSDSANNRILVAHRDKILSIPKTTGVPATVDSGLDDTGGPVRFLQVDDNSYWVNGIDAAKQWDGTTVTNFTLPAGPPVVTNIMFWKQRFFVLSSNNRVDFSDIYVPNASPTWSSVNFFYLGSPKSADHVTGWKIFRDGMVIFTHETKWVIIGSDISTFTYTQAVGTKGAVSQEAIAADRNYIYFMADDKQIYRYNGVSDELISQNVQPELDSIVDFSKVRLDIYNNQLRVYYPKSPSSTSNRMLLRDLEQNQWFMDTGHPVVGSTNLYLNNNELVEFSALAGQVFYGEFQNSDLGKKIDWEFRTNYKTYGYRRRSGQTLGGATAKKRIKRFRPIVRTGTAKYTMQVGTDFDFTDRPVMRDYLVDSGGTVWGGFVWGDGTLWGSGNKQIQNRAEVSGRANHIQYRFKRSGVDTPVELYGYAAFIKLGRQK